MDKMDDQTIPPNGLVVEMRKLRRSIRPDQLRPHGAGLGVGIHVAHHRCEGIAHHFGIRVQEQEISAPSEGQALGKGQKLGLIRFGSRVDLFMPPSSVTILVKKGDRLRAGVTRIAEVCDGRVE